MSWDILYLEQYFSLTTYLPRFALDVRRIIPLAFRLAVCVNPMDSPRFQRLSVLRFFFVGLYLHVFLDAICRSTSYDGELSYDDFSYYDESASYLCEHLLDTLNQRKIRMPFFCILLIK